MVQGRCERAHSEGSEGIYTAIQRSEQTGPGERLDAFNLFSVVSSSTGGAEYSSHCDDGA